tara:strand:- start:1840 stop:1956 length:117 start_codon:yes stop_codon:yes gene_type:complete
MREKLEVFIHDQESIGDFPMKKLNGCFSSQDPIKATLP